MKKGMTFLFSLVLMSTVLLPRSRAHMELQEEEMRNEA